MPNAFDETLVLAADSFFLLPGAETVTYLPKTGASRKIKAVIKRVGIEDMNDRMAGRREQLEVLVKNSSSDGIASTEVDTGGDKLEIAVRSGKKPVKTPRIVEILSQNAGTMNLKVF